MLGLHCNASISRRLLFGAEAQALHLLGDLRHVRIDVEVGCVIIWLPSGNLTRWCPIVS